MEPGLDLFISHASEDKEAVARPLRDALTARGWSVWLDEFDLTVGDSLNEQIDAALLRTRFGLVILSRAFFSKRWPRRELNALAAREVTTGTKIILPVWHEVGQAEVLEYSPMLADRLAASTARGLTYVADEVSRALDVAAQRNAESSATETLVHAVPLSEIRLGSEVASRALDVTPTSVDNARRGWSHWLEELFRVTSGSYDVLFAHVKWNLSVADGTEATCDRTAQLKFKRSGIRTLFDSFWGDGDLRTDYVCDPGVPIDLFALGTRTYVAVALDRAFTAGEEIRFHSRRHIADAFTNDEEWIELANIFSTGPTTLEIVFPHQRPPNEARVVVPERNESSALSVQRNDEKRPVLRVAGGEHEANLLRVEWSW